MDCWKIKLVAFEVRTYNHSKGIPVRNEEHHIINKNGVKVTLSINTQELEDVEMAFENNLC